MNSNQKFEEMIALKYFSKNIFVYVATLARCFASISSNNDCVIDGCTKYYDGCNDITCDVTGTEIDRTSIYCKYSVYPWKAKCLMCNEEKPDCADFTCPDGCSTYYDGCNDITCDVVTGKMIDITDKYCGPNYNYYNYKPSTYKPEEAKCKKRFCPKSCEKWSDGCNKYKCDVNRKFVVKKSLTNNICNTDNDEYTTTNPKCIKYANCSREEGWTPAKMFWCCKKEKKEGKKNMEGCPCDGNVSGRCNNKGKCKNGDTCTTLVFGPMDIPLDVCCP